MGIGGRRFQAAASRGIQPIVRRCDTDGSVFNQNSFSLNPFIAFINGDASIFQGKISVGVHAVILCGNMKGSPCNIEKSQRGIIFVCTVYSVFSGGNGEISVGNAYTVFSAQAMAGSLDGAGAAGYHQVVFGDNTVSVVAVNIQSSGAI